MVQIKLIIGWESISNCVFSPKANTKDTMLVVLTDSQYNALKEINDDFHLVCEHLCDVVGAGFHDTLGASWYIDGWEECFRM